MRTVISSVAIVLALATTGCPTAEGGSLLFIPGSGVLPECAEAPSVSVTGHWFDNGTLTIRNDGCPGATEGDALTVCALDWLVTQSGRDVSIEVDSEYRIDGRVCGDQLHLQGGWWLPTEDPPFGCTYDDDTADEVGIEAEGNVLSVTDGRMTGTLVVRGRCTADYAMSLERLE